MAEKSLVKDSAVRAGTLGFSLPDGAGAAPSSLLPPQAATKVSAAAAAATQPSRRLTVLMLCPSFTGDDDTRVSLGPQVIWSLRRALL
jgi:hypothetical protein